MKNCLFSFLLLVQATFTFAATEISMLSEPGDYIGQGLNYSFTEANGAFTVSSSENLLTISYTSTSGSDRFTYNFNSPDSLTTGRYFNATRYPFQGAKSPGLSVSGNGRGCNTLSGHFIIYEISVVNNSVQNLALDFVQHCENGAPALNGSVRINSTIALPNPLPTAYAGEDKTVIENTTTTLDGSQSYDADGSIVTYFWEQLSGQTVSITDPNIATTDFLIPDSLPLGGEDFEFRLTATDDSGNQSMDNIIVHGRSSLDAYTYISMVSDAGDYIGGGLTYDLNQDNGVFTITSAPDFVRISYSGGTNNLDFNFKSQGELTTGTYFDALRYPFQGPTNPGLSVSGNGRGCNTLTGHFVVFDISVINGVVETLALDFEQHCEGGSAALRGSVRINSNVPVTNPFPVAYAGKDILTDENTVISLNGSQSFDADGVIQSHSWQQISGTTVAVVDNNSPLINITTPAKVPLGGEDLEFALTVTDDSGNQSTDNVVIHVNSKSDPKTYMIFNSDPGDYIGAGIDWYYSLSNAFFSISDNFDNGISVNVSSTENWSLDFATIGNASLTNGVYTNATRFPFQDITSNGLNVSGDGRGCNQLTGQFEILSLTYENAVPRQFAATFEQHCESNAAALFGEIYVNVVDPSVPVSDAGVDIVAAENSNVTLNGSDSYDSDGNIVSYLWTQISGIAVDLSDVTDIRPSFTTPALGDRELASSLEFELLIEDNSGFMSASAVTVMVSADNTAPLANNFNVSVELDTPLNIDVVSNTSDADGTINIASLDITKSPENGSLLIKSNGTVDFTPATGYLGTDSFEYTVKDNDGVISNTASAFLTVSDGSVSTATQQPNNSSAGALNYLFLLLLFLIKMTRSYREL